MNSRFFNYMQLLYRTGCPVLLAAFLLVCTLQPVAAQEPSLVVFDTPRGSVTFDHEAHQLKLEDCQACHHAGQQPGNCRACHVGAPGIPRSKDALHKTCKGCHLKTSGPIRCDACHGERPVS